MTEQEKLMYEILGQITTSDIPIVFKGGLITKLILNESGLNSVQRTTKDIDAIKLLRHGNTEKNNLPV